MFANASESKDPSPTTESCLKLMETIDAFSPLSLKQSATTMIWEEIARIRDRIREYEEQIRACQVQISFWMSQKNRLVDIAKLPEEILINIWSYSARRANENKTLFKNWLGVTHVSSHWRKIALATPGLWCWPSVIFPKAVSTLLPRAGTSLLHLRVERNELIGLAAERLANSFRLAGKILHQAESLTLLSMDSPFVDVGIGHNVPEDIAARDEFMNQLKAPGALTKLKILNLCCSFEDDVDIMQLRGHLRTTLDPTILIRSSSSLHSLYLVNRSILNLPSDLGTIHNLTTLNIRFTEDRWQTNYSYRAPFPIAIATLRRLPNLQTLSLMNAFHPKRDDDQMTEFHNPFTLTSLRSLYLACEADEINLFLRYVGGNPATLTKASLEITPGRATRPQTPSSTFSTRSDSVEALLDNALCRWIGSAIEGLAISAKDQNHYCVELRTASSRRCLTAGGLLSSPEQQLIIYWPVHPWLPFHHLPHSGLFDQLETLEYSLNVPDMEMWKAFGLLPNIKNLRGVDFDCHPHLLKIISCFQSGDSIFEPHTMNTQACPSSELYFPKLKRLTECSYSDSFSSEIDVIFQARKYWETGIQPDATS